MPAELTPEEKDRIRRDVPNLQHRVTLTAEAIRRAQAGVDKKRALAEAAEANVTKAETAHKAMQDRLATAEAALAELGDN